MLVIALFVIACVGVCSSTVFLGLALVGTAHARKQWRELETLQGHFPAVSVLKPLHGMEPQLERNLESFFAQEYAGEFELLFCARVEGDAGLTLARELGARYPRVRARYLVAGETPFTNAKVWSLAQMEEAAAHEVLVVTDSDVEVGRDYLRRLVQPFVDAQVGCVTCLYRGKPTGGLWSRLEGLGMSVEMTSGVVIANLLEGMRFALGPTMAMRREAVEQFGGFRVLGDFCSDDFLVGNWIAARGWRVVLSDYVIDHVIQNRSFADSIRHQTRWMRSTRFSRPKGHLGTGLTFAVPFGFLALACGVATGRPVLGLALFAWAVLSRVLQAAAVGWGMVRDKRAVSGAWMYPLRDLMGFYFWAASYASSRIVWRDQVYRLVEEGRMVLEESEKARSESA